MSCKISYQKINNKPFQVGFPSYKVYDCEWNNSLILSAANSTQTINIPSEEIIDQKEGEGEIYRMGLCKKHYFSYWNFVVEKEEKKCKVQDLPIDFYFVNIYEGEMFGVIFREENITSTLYPISYENFIIEQEQPRVDIGSAVVKLVKTIEHVKNGKEITFIFDGAPPIIFRYSDGVLFVEKHGNPGVVNIRKIAFSKKEMEKNLTTLLQKMRNHPIFMVRVESKGVESKEAESKAFIKEKVASFNIQGKRADKGPSISRDIVNYDFAHVD